MKPPFRISNNASRICSSCRKRGLASSARRSNDMLEELSRTMAGTTISQQPQPRARIISTATKTSTSQPASSPRPDLTSTRTSKPGLAPTSITSAFAPIRQTLQKTFQSQVIREQQQQQQQADSETAASKQDIFSGALAGMSAHEASLAMEGQMPRRWVSGDVYSVHDLGPREAQKWSILQRRPKRDIFEMLEQDPRRHYKNMRMLAEFVTDTGRIKHSNTTGLKPKNQRKLAKAVRRAIGTGLMPSCYRHPEVIAKTLGIDMHLRSNPRWD